MVSKARAGEGRGRPAERKQEKLERAKRRTKEEARKARYSGLESSLAGRT
jgi:hypothetical protein